MQFLMFISQFVFLQSIFIISEGSLKECINSDQSKDISCKTKIKLSLKVQNAKLEYNDYVETTIDKVKNKNGNIQKFSSRVKISLFKSPVAVQYPLNNIKDFNYLPHEVIITSNKCKDGSTDSNPTCGWIYSILITKK